MWDQNQVDQAMHSLWTKVSAVRHFNQYQYFLGTHEGIEKQKKSTLSGPRYEGGFNWPYTTEEMWVKGELTIPEHIAGIPTVGSKVVLYHMATCYSKLYINGIKKVEDQWWTSLDLPLTNKLTPPATYDFTLCVKRVEGNAGFSLPHIYIDRVELYRLKIDAFFSILKFIDSLIQTKQVNEPKFVILLEHIKNNIPLHLITEDRVPEFIVYLQETEPKLKPFTPYLKKYTSYLMGHAHIDMNWLWVWENTISTCRDTFQQVTLFAKEYPDFCFSQSQAAVYKIIEDNCPSLFKEIKKMVARGRWDVTASTWVEGDLNIASGEALIRQTLYAKQYTRQKFGVESRIAWCPDTFGHAVSYPQILKKSEVDFYYFCRCGKNIPLFYWEGIDGSRILAFNELSTYNGTIWTHIADRLNQLGKEHKLYCDLFSYGVGNHGGGPTRRDIENAKVLQNLPYYPQLKFSTTHDYFKCIEKQNPKLPVVNDELQYIFEGCYTTHSDVKKYNRESENLLYTAEIVASLADLYGLKYPLPDITQAWQKTCFNQFHDILDGSAIHSAYDYTHQTAKEIKETAQTIINRSLQHLTGLISIPSEPELGVKPVLLFNPLSWHRDDIVELDISTLGFRPGIVKDVNGNVLSSQIIDNKIYFYVTQIPAFGYTTCFLYPETSSEVKGTNLNYAPVDTVFENERYLIQLDLNTGGITRLYDKKSNREIIDGFDQGNMFKLYTEVPHDMTGWNIGRIDTVRSLAKHTRVKRTVKGLVCDLIELECTFANSKLTQQIIFFKPVNKIEFRTYLSWHELGTPSTGVPMLRVSFPVKFTAPHTVYEIPFAAVNRPNVGQEAPALKWVDYSDGKIGLALLNDCKYGYNVRGNNIELTLIRSPYEPDLNPDGGEHTFTYTLYPHSGTWQDSNVVHKGYELNIPLIPILVDRKTASPKRSKLPVEKSFFSTNQSNIIVSCWKKAEDGNGYIIHAYESKGRNTTVTLDFGIDIKTVSETNLIERNDILRKLTGTKLVAKFRKWEIKSYRIKR